MLTRSYEPGEGGTKEVINFKETSAMKIRPRVKLMHVSCFFLQLTIVASSTDV